MQITPNTITKLESFLIPKGNLQPELYSAEDAVQVLANIYDALKAKGYVVTKDYTSTYHLDKSSVKCYYNPAERDKLVMVCVGKVTFYSGIQLENSSDYQVSIAVHVIHLNKLTLQDNIDML